MVEAKYLPARRRGMPTSTRILSATRCPLVEAYEGFLAKRQRCRAAEREKSRVWQLQRRRPETPGRPGHRLRQSVHVHIAGAE